MGRSKVTSRQFLELHNGKWRVTIAVPRRLHKKLGTRLKRHLQTDSLSLANTMKWQAVTELRAIIDHADGRDGGDKLTKEALDLAQYRSRAQDPDEVDALDEGIMMRADAIRGDPIETICEPGVLAVDPPEVRQRHARASDRVLEPA